MTKFSQFLTAAAFSGAAMLSAPAFADAVDTFEIDVILEDLENVQDADEFEKRLKRKARQYCRNEAPYASRSDLKECEAEIVAAVVASLDDQNVQVAWSN